MTAEKQTAKKGMPVSPGRPKGKPNKTTTILKEAILQAAECVGEDGAGAEGLTGYLKRVAREDVKAFTTLLGKVLPLQLTGDLDATMTIRWDTGKTPDA